MAPGTFQALCGLVAAPETGDLPEHRFIGGQRDALRLLLLVSLTGTGVLAATVQPVLRRNRQFAADTELQYDLVESSVTVHGADAAQVAAFVTIPLGMELAVRVTAISGTNAKVSVNAVAQPGLGQF